MLYRQQAMELIPGIGSQYYSFANKKIEKDKDNKVDIDSIKRTKNNVPCINVETFAKQNSDMGRNQMFKWLRSNGYISKQKSSWNMPQQRYINQGLFKLHITYILTNDEQVPKFSPLITAKGCDYLMKQLMKGMQNA
jgi:phage antirepressor YoqD-like protein